MSVADKTADNKWVANKKAYDRLVGNLAADRMVGDK